MTIGAGEWRLDELTVRRPNERTSDVARTMYRRGPDQHLRWPDRRVVILVHGYNVSEADARRTYAGFLTDLEAAVWPDGLDRYGSFWALHWPGDHWLGALSPIGFPTRMGAAQDAGRRLADMVTKCLHPSQEVFVVAHSLGCLVVLEALHALAEWQQANSGKTVAAVRGIFLMAAAVAQGRCGAGEDYGRRARGQPAEWVAHSRWDLVLRAAFPPGRLLAGGRGGQAVGIHGRPGRDRWEELLDTGLGHGGYWTSWWHVITAMPRFLGHATPLPAAERTVAPSDVEPASVRLDERQLGSRRIGDPLEHGWVRLWDPA